VGMALKSFCAAVRAFLVAAWVCLIVMVSSCLLITWWSVRITFLPCNRLCTDHASLASYINQRLTRATGYHYGALHWCRTLLWCTISLSWCAVWITMHFCG
jgi:hypothetical protein